MGNVIKCPECGAKNEDGVRSCIYCGTLLSSTVKPQPQPSSQNSQSQSRPEQNNQNNQKPKDNTRYSSKSRILAGILNILIPGVGNMYAGYVGKGIVQLILSPCAIGGIWSLIDGIIILVTNNYPDSMGLPMKS